MRRLHKCASYAIIKAPPHNSAARLAMSFPPSAACKFLDLHPVNLRNLHLHLTKNPFASRPPHLRGVTLESAQNLLRCFMKLLFIIGDAAVGKMTVGQELMKITNLRLFHNHMSIEPVIEIFGRYDGKTISEIRDVIFKNYAASDNYGMIFTMMMDFDLPSEWEYLEHIKGIFEPYGTDFYYVELIAPQEIRLKRNISENRLKNKASKRDIETSNQRLINDDKNHRCVSYDGEIPFDNYLRIDNSDIEPDEVERLIKKTFNL